MTANGVSTDLATSEGGNSRPCRLLVRSKKGIEIFACPERTSDPVPYPALRSDDGTTTGRPFVVQGSTSFCHMAPDGSMAYVHLTGAGVIRIPLEPKQLQSIQFPFTASTTKLHLANSKNVQMLHISPKGTYLLTWERYHTETSPLNLKLWHAESGRLIGLWMQKNIKSCAWPYLQWTHDEAFGLLLMQNEIRIYPASSFGDTSADSPEKARYQEKLRLPGIVSMSVPSTGQLTTSAVGKISYWLTSFVVGSKDRPSRAGFHAWTAGASASTAATYPAVLSKSLFQAEEMKVHWNPAGDAALITIQTAVDTTGQSYYGSSQLFLLSSVCKDVVAVPLPHEGPVYDVQWLPRGDKPPCFVAVAGRMPSMASLHHGTTAAALFQFGQSSRNTICWSPHGRFLCLAGWGNLQGSVQFWDRHKGKLIAVDCAANAAGSLRIDAAVGFGWSPNSRLFVTSTTTPRINVDNGIRLFRYTGTELINNVPWNNADYRPGQLFQAAFIPVLEPHEEYPDRPQTPPILELLNGPNVAASGDPSKPAAFSAHPELKTGGAAAPALTPSTSVGRYVPPSARNRPGGGAGGTSLAERMRREKDGGSIQTAGRVKPVGPISIVSGQAVVGLSSAGAGGGAAGKSKSTLKREKFKRKKEEEVVRQAASAAALPDASSTPNTGDPVATLADTDVTTATASISQPEPLDLADAEKRSRKIKKLLKQIDDLKERPPSSLNDDQKAKIASEVELQAELESLGF